MRHRADKTAGFSLIEMMITVAIMGIVTAQLFVVFANQKKVYMSNERALDAQETSRLTLDMISFDTRMAGYMVAEYAAVSSFDGGADHADRLCVSTASTGSKDSTAIANVVSPWKGARVTAIGTSSITIESDDPNFVPSDFDGDGFADFTENAGIIVATDTSTYCTRIRSVTPTQITFASPAGEDASAILGPPSPFRTTTDMRAVPATIYELDEDPDKLELRRNTLLLASQIEDFQVEYWIDNASATADNGVEDGDTEYPVNNLNTPDPPNPGMMPANDLIRRVRVTVTARTNREEGSTSAAGHRMYGRPALANRVAGAEQDSFRRRTFIASILPRNITTLIDED